MAEFCKMKIYRNYAVPPYPASLYCVGGKYPAGWYFRAQDTEGSPVVRDFQTTLLGAGEHHCNSDKVYFYLIVALVFLV